jgi:hypothetical protein
LIDFQNRPSKPTQTVAFHLIANGQSNVPLRPFNVLPWDNEGSGAEKMLTQTPV